MCAVLGCLGCLFQSEKDESAQPLTHKHTLTHIPAAPSQPTTAAARHRPARAREIEADTERSEKESKLKRGGGALCGWRFPEKCIHEFISS